MCQRPPDPRHTSAILRTSVTAVAAVVGTIGIWIALIFRTPKRWLFFGSGHVHHERTEHEIFDRDIRLA
jgi:hypothetical protein